MGLIGPRANDNRTSVSAGFCDPTISIGGVIVCYKLTRLCTLPCGLEGFVAVLHCQLIGGHLVHCLLNPWNEHDGLATPPACVIMHDIASVPCNWSRPSYRFHSNVGWSLAPPRHLSFWVLGRLHVSMGLWLTNLLRFSNYCICTNDIIPYEWFRALEYYRTYVRCSLGVFLVRKTED